MKTAMASQTPPAWVTTIEMLWYWSNPSEMLRENWITGISTDTKAPYDEQIVVGLDH